MGALCIAGESGLFGRPLRHTGGLSAQCISGAKSQPRQSSDQNEIIDERGRFTHTLGSRRDQEEGGGAGPSSEPRRDREQGGGAGLRKLDFNSFASGCSSTAVQRTLSLWLCPARQLKQQLRGALVAAQWRGDTALTLPLSWRRSTVSPVFWGRYPWSSLHTLSSPSPPVPVPNKQPRFCGRKATWSRRWADGGPKACLQKDVIAC